MGKPTTAYKKKDKPKSPVSPVWLCESSALFDSWHASTSSSYMIVLAFVRFV